MILQQYIQEVLYRQQVCSVPQIGTFTLEHIPARYNMVDKLLYPPGQMILFAEQWTDDGSCLEWISLKENLVAAVAQRKLDKYIAELKASLQTGQPLLLPGIGALQAGPEGHLNFTQDALPDTLEPLQLQPVLRPDAAPRVTVGTTEVVNQQVVEHLTPVPDDDEPAMGRFRWWWVALPLAAAVTAFVIWWFVSRPGTPANNPSNDMARQPAAVDTMTLPAGVTQTDSSAGARPAPSDTLQYYVVFATYTDRAKAERQYRKLKGWGHNVAMYSTKDSATVKLAMPFRSLAADTAANIEAVRKNYGGKVYLEF